MTMNVVQFPTVNTADLPAALRWYAQAIESGQIEADAAVLVLHHGRASDARRRLPRRSTEDMTIPIPNLSVTGWLKIAGAVAIVAGVLWLGFEFNRRGERIETLKVERDTYKGAVATYQTANADWAKADKLRRDIAEKDAKARRETAAAAAAEVGKSKAAAAAAEKRAAKWRDQFNNRPQGCAAALAALDTACPSLRGF